MSEETTTKSAAPVIDLPMPGTANLARQAPQANPFADTMWTEERISLIKREICPAGISDGEFLVFLEKCKRSGLDPLLGEAYCVPRWQKVKYPDPKGRREPDGSPVMLEKTVERFTFQAAEQGMQVRAHRSGDFEGVRFGAIYANDECAIDFAEGKVLHRAAAGKPRGALIGAWAIAKRKGRDFHPVAHVLFSEFVQNNAMWKGKPETMIAKCARALALRLAYPYEFAGVFTAEEMAAGIDLDHDATPGELEVADRTPVDENTAGASKSDDLEAFLKSRAPQAKPPAAAPKPAANSTVNAQKPTAAPPAASSKPPPPVGDQAPPPREPPGPGDSLPPQPRPADVINFPSKASPPPAAKPASSPAPSPAAADDSIKIASTGATVKISEATVAQLEEAKAFAEEQVRKSPTATWVPRVKAKLEQVGAELARRAQALEQALEAPDETTDAEPPNPLDGEPPEPGSEG